MITSNHLESLVLEIIHQGGLVEVAHCWTNDIERCTVQVLSQALEKKNHIWIDYANEGSALTNLKHLLFKGDDINNRPQALQSYMGKRIMPWARDDLLVDLSDIAHKEQWSKHLPKIVNDSIQYEGRYIAVPLNRQRVNWMWINDSTFKKNNINHPTTWKEFFIIADKLKSRGCIPLSTCDDAWQNLILFETLVLGIGGAQFHHDVLVEPNKQTIQSDTMEKVFEHLKAIKSFIIRTDSWIESAAQVIEGQAAMYIMGDWAKGAFKASGINYGENGYMAIPTPQTQGIFLNSTDVFVFPKVKEKHLSGQKALAQMIMEEEVQENFNLSKGSIPARLNVASRNFDEVSHLSMKSVGTDIVVPSFTFEQTCDEYIRKPTEEFIDELFNNDFDESHATKHLSVLLTKRID